VDDHIAEIDPDAESDALVLGHLGIAIDHSSLDLDCTTDGVDDAREIDQHAVAGSLDDAAAVLSDLRVYTLAAMRLEAFEPAFLARYSQPGLAGHFGGEDRGNTPFDRLFHGLSLPH